MNISGIKLLPGLFRYRIYKSITCSVPAKLWHIKKALSSEVIARVVVVWWKEHFQFMVWITDNVINVIVRKVITTIFIEGG